MTESSPTSRATLSDVAAVAGVSIATVSRALHGRGEISAATRSRVRGVARELGYSRTDDRRGRPRAGTARLVDLVLDGFHNPWADEVVAGARTAAADLGYDLVLTIERDDPDDDWPKRVRTRGSAGVVLGLIRPTAAQFELLDEVGIPIVLLDPRSSTPHTAAIVATTDRDGGVVAAEHLIATGAERFVAVGGRPPYLFGRARLEGFVETVAARIGADRLSVVTATWSRESVHAAVLPVLRASAADGSRIGVFGCNDEMALGVYRAADALGLRIPEDVQVIGFDDTREAANADPDLTTVRQPVRQMAAMAVHLVHRAADGRVAPTARHELPTRLVVRGSTLDGATA